MKMPCIQGVIDRRILANYRVDPEVLNKILPNPFRPKTVNGYGIAGICLIRLIQIRPRFAPSFIGVRSENAAHRIAVEWEHQGRLRSGVYVPRRDSSSWINTFAGGRIFPGVQHRARFEVLETDDRFRIEMTSIDGTGHVLVDAHLAEQLTSGSTFDSLSSVSDFFEQGSIGYSPHPISNSFDGMELSTWNWHVEPLHVDEIKSSFFEDENTFPKGSLQFDCGLLMKHVHHEWRQLESVCCDAGQS